MLEPSPATVVRARVSESKETVRSSHPVDVSLTRRRTSQSGSIEISEPDDSQAKSKYWLAESYLKLEKEALAINLFEDLVSHHKLHYLSLAAERRLANLFGIHGNKD